MKKFGEIILAAPGSVITGMVLLIFLAIYPASQIRTDFNLEGFYPEEDPVIEDYDLLEEEFGRDDNTILVGFSSDSLISHSVLNDIEKLTAEFEEIENIESVRSITKAQQIQNINDRLTFSDYIDDIPKDSETLYQLKQQLTTDPLLEGALINASGNTTAFLLRIIEEQNTYPNRNKIISEIESILQEFSGSYEFHKSGIPYFRNQYVNLLNGH